jgi:RNA polymerase sigma factor (sigma-70 family)
MQDTAGRFVEAAFIEHHAALQRRLTVICRDGEAAQDLAQEAFLRLAGEVEAGRIPDDPAAWLHRVGRNLAMSRGRHLQVVDRRNGELPRPGVASGPEEAAIEHETASAAVRALDGLPASARRALVLAAHGCPGTEIAASIGRTPGATRTLLCRARGRVRQTMLMYGFTG